MVVELRYITIYDSYIRIERDDLHTNESSISVRVQMQFSDNRLEEQVP